MNIFVTGAGGYIGGSVAMALLASGHHVLGLTRSGASAERLAKIGIDPVLGTLDDADARGQRRSDKIFDEDTPLLVNPSKQARRELDLMVLGAAENAIRSAVICPSLIYGEGRGLNPRSVQVPFLAANAREKGIVQIVGRGLNVWSNVHIDDVADLYLLALTQAPAGAFYFAENGEASFGDIAAAIAKRLGLAGIQALPLELAAERWGESKAYFTLGSNGRVRARRERRELGWEPRHASLIEWILTEMPG